MTHTTSCRCACGSGLQTVARDAGFAATSVEVLACSECAAAGVVAHKVTKSGFARLLAPAEVVSHRDGLVTFAGGI